MRSFLILGGVALSVGVLVFSGVLPRRAGAAGRLREAWDDPGPGVELRYADFDAEQRLLSRARPALPPVTYVPKDSYVNQAPPGADRLAQPPAEPATTEPAAPAEDEGSAIDCPEPVARAGSDRVLWAGMDDAQLDGSRSTGRGLSYSWRQVDGPRPLAIADPTESTTSAAGFSPEATASWDDAEYQFELTVTDACGQQSVDTVHYTARVDPGLHITPRPKRQLAYRDGYLLAHYEVRTTNRRDDVQVVELQAPAKLFVQHFAGDGDFAITSSQSGETHVHQIAVYRRDGETQTWLEFFVDTPQRVPAMVQVGVNWE